MNQRTQETEDLPPAFSIVTVSWNNAHTIADTARSVVNQQGVTFEHIVKDAGSTDGTVEAAMVINPAIRAEVSKDAGIYDAMNQGYALAQGDVVAFLNSDDYFAHGDVLAAVKARFDETGCDIVYGDIQIIDEAGTVLRHWVGDGPKRGSLNAKQLPHPAVFVRREHLEKLGLPFDASYRISADVKQQLLLVEKMGLWAEHVPQTLTIMRSGGESSASARAVFKGWQECARAYHEVHNSWGWGFVARKFLAKLPHIQSRRNPNEGTGS